jgi:RNA polymerase sigma-70 factor (ECF subfamily)
VASPGPRRPWPQGARPLTYPSVTVVETTVRRTSLPAEVQAVSDNADLLARAKAGDAEAFRVIFHRQAPGVRRFLGDLLRDDAAADEGTQETFVRAHQRLSTLEQPAALTGWLLGIARMVFFEHLRKKRRDGHTQAPEDDGPALQIDRAPNAEALMLTREADRMLEGALESLSEDRRAALLMRIDHDLGYGEIAAAMGWPLQKVKNEIHRARQKLREELQPYLEGRA